MNYFILPIQNIPAPPLKITQLRPCSHCKTKHGLNPCQGREESKLILNFRIGSNSEIRRTGILNNARRICSCLILSSISVDLEVRVSLTPSVCQSVLYCTCNMSAFILICIFFFTSNAQINFYVKICKSYYI